MKVFVPTSQKICSIEPNDVNSPNYSPTPLIVQHRLTDTMVETIDPMELEIGRGGKRKGRSHGIRPYSKTVLITTSKKLTLKGS